jgi:hypothetical protein
MNKQQKSELESQAKHLAGKLAQASAEDYAVRFIQQLGADLSTFRGRTYILHQTAFENVFATVRSTVFDAAFEKHFEEKHAELGAEAKRKASDERRYRKHEAECDAWRKQRDADRDYDARVAEDRIAQIDEIVGRKVRWLGNLYLVHKPLTDNLVRLVTIDGETFVDAPVADVEFDSGEAS